MILGTRNCLTSPCVNNYIHLSKSALKSFGPNHQKCKIETGKWLFIFILCFIARRNNYIHLSKSALKSFGPNHQKCKIETGKWLFIFILCFIARRFIYKKQKLKISNLFVEFVECNKYFTH